MDWSHKKTQEHFPPNGYAFLVFREEASVQRLVERCLCEDGKLYVSVSSVTQVNKKVQIRPWKITDSAFIMDQEVPLPRDPVCPSVSSHERPASGSTLHHVRCLRHGSGHLGDV